MNWKVGDICFYAFCEFDGSGIVKGTITEVNDDYCIMTGENGLKYWMDEDINTYFETEIEAQAYVQQNKFENIVGMLYAECY